MKRPKRRVVRIEETLHHDYNGQGILDVVVKDRLHLECGHYIDEAKGRVHKGDKRRCHICQGKKVLA